MIPILEQMPVTNTNAVIQSIEGDGSTKTVDVSAIETGSDDIQQLLERLQVMAVFCLIPDAVDTLVKGGDLQLIQQRLD